MAKSSKTIRPLYDCTVLLGGSRDNSVFVSGISATEIYVLKAIHGANETGTDPITNVKKTGKGVDRTDAQERARIGVRYNAPGNTGGIAILNRLYGVGNPLPLEYETPQYGDNADLPLPGDVESVIDIDVDENDDVVSVPEPKTKKTKVESVLEQ